MCSSRLLFSLIDESTEVGSRFSPFLAKALIIWGILARWKVLGGVLGEILGEALGGVSRVLTKVS